MFHKRITLSFDDGVEQDVRLIEMLDRYGLKATFNLNSALLGDQDELEVRGVTVPHIKVQPEQVAERYRNHEVAVHTLTHPRLTELSEEDILREVAEDQKALSELVGYDVVGMAYPCGGKNYDEMVMQVLETETTIKYARTIIPSHNFEAPQRFLEWHPTCHMLQEDTMALVEAFDKAEPEKDMLLYIWGHSYELDAVEDRWTYMENLCARLAAVKGAEFMTNREAYEALKSR